MFNMLIHICYQYICYNRLFHQMTNTFLFMFMYEVWYINVICDKFILTLQKIEYLHMYLCIQIKLSYYTL